MAVVLGEALVELGARRAAVLFGNRERAPLDRGRLAPVRFADAPVELRGAPEAAVELGEEPGDVELGDDVWLAPRT